MDINIVKDKRCTPLTPLQSRQA